MSTGEKKAKIKSPDYPTISLPDAVERTRHIYEKDHNHWIPTEVAAKHLNYSGLTGMSRMVLSALRKFGLVEYKGGELRVSELAMAVIEPKNSQERAEGLTQMLEMPRMYQAVKEMAGDTWELPSKDTLRARLIRDYGFNPSAVPGFIDDLEESIEFVKNSNEGQVATQRDSDREHVSPQGSDQPKQQSAPKSEMPPGLHRFSIPGENWFVAFPDDMNARQARRMRDWIKKVVLPNLDFLADDEENKTAEP